MGKVGTRMKRLHGVSNPDAGGGKARWLVGLMALLAVLVVAGCGGGSGSSSAGGESTGAETTADTEGESTTAASGSGELQPPEYAQQIEALAAEKVPAGKYKRPGPYTLALLDQGPSNGWGKTYEVTAEWAAKENPEVSDFTVADSEGNVQTQTTQMEDAISRKPDAIIVHPAGDGLVGPATKAMEAGIPVVLCSNGLPDSNSFATQVAVNYWSTGVELARRLATMMGEKGNVVFMGGLPTYQHTIIYQEAAKKTFAAEFPEVHITDTTMSEYSIAKGKTDMEALLASNPTIDGVYTAGSEAAIGALQAFEERGAEMPAFAVSNDLNGFVRLAEENEVEFVAAPAPASMSASCIDTAVDLLKGKSVPRFIDAEVVTPDSEIYDDSEAKKHYYPEFSDEFVGPPIAPASVYKGAGLGR